MLATTEERRSVPQRSLRVLVVDDDGLQLRAVQRALKGNPQVELAVCDNAIDALLAVGSLRPDLVVMDVFMPGLDGLEACRRITKNAETRDVRVVLASAAMTPELANTARCAGAYRAVGKPIDLASVLDIALEPEPEPEPAPATVRGADLLVSMLADAGVDVVFGIPGGAISPVHDALLDSQLRAITTRHESGAMFAAAAYARTTGKLAVVAVTSGPGVLNAMTGLASAWCDGVPVLLLVGEVPRPAHGRGVLQDGSAHGLKIVETVRHVSKLAIEVPSASSLPHLLRRAIATALSGRRGPVVMTLPLDITTAQLAPPATSGTVALETMVDAHTVTQIADLLLHAQRPLILAGNGVRGDGAPPRLVAVAERLQCPVATTPKGKGVFPEDHPLALGVFGLGGHPSARSYVDSSVDVVLALGTSLGDLSTDQFTPELQAPRALIHVDIDTARHGKSYAPTHAVLASAADFLGNLADQLALRDHEPRRGPLPGVIRSAMRSSAKPDRIAPHDLLRELQQLLPPDAIYTVDSGEHFLFAVHYLESTLPDSFLVMTGLGSMGQSIGAAVGAKLAHPHRQVAAICGDGCFAMNAFEIATAVQERLPIRVLVFNDGRLGMVENGHQTVYGRHPSYPTDPLDVCSIARGLGATSLRVDQPGQLSAARELLLGAPGPVVIDVMIDGDLSLPKRDRVAAMVPGVKPRPQPRVVN